MVVLHARALLMMCAVLHCFGDESIALLQTSMCVALDGCMAGHGLCMCHSSIVCCIADLAICPQRAAPAYVCVPDSELLHHTISAAWMRLNIRLLCIYAGAQCTPGAASATCSSSTWASRCARCRRQL